LVVVGRAMWIIVPLLGAGFIEVGLLGALDCSLGVGVVGV